MVSEEAEKCPKYQSCGAPLCPRDMDIHRAWYVDEPVCKATEYKEAAIIKVQRMLKDKRNRDTNVAWTFESLMHECKQLGLLEQGNIGKPIRELKKLVNPPEQFHSTSGYVDESVIIKRIKAMNDKKKEKRNANRKNG